MRRRLAAIMAGDVVGYSRMMAEDESGTYASLRSALDEIVDPVVSGHGGHVFKTTGDGFLAAFESVGEALEAALAIQQGFVGRSLQMRLGLNLGDVIEEANDVFGDGVNVAARLEAMAEPGGICVSAAVARAGRTPHLRFDRVGRKRGKNMPEAIEVFTVTSRAQRRRRMVSPRAIAAAAFGALAIGVGAIALYDGRVVSTLAEQAMAWRGSPADVAAAPAVAVLPFNNLSGDGSQDYFSDGLTEDIITGLARNRELLVIARNSTFAFKGRSADIRAVGTQLGADYVVEGSARRAGDQLRVAAQLIDARTGTHLWSKSYDRHVEDVFAVQDDLTSEIVAALTSYVRESESAAAASRPTGSVRAYDLVLQGRERYQHGSADPKALLDARQLFARAVDLDPGYAAARANLGLTYIIDRLAGLTGTATDHDLDEGLAHVREAIRLEPELALGYQVLSYGLVGSSDYEGAMRAAQRAVELNPSDPDSLMSLAKAEVRFGAYDRAVADAERARRLNPLAPQYYPYIHGLALYAAGRHGDARQVLADCLLRVPRERNCLRLQVAVLMREDRAQEARQLVAQLIQVDPTFSLASERAMKRFGDSPLTDSYLADLAAAGAPEVGGQVHLDLREQRAG